MRLLGILICLMALALTGYSALTYKAPAIEADIAQRTAEALSAAALDDVKALVDGRHVTLQGHLADPDQRQQILRLAASVPGALGPIDRLDQAVKPSFFRFVAIKDDTGLVNVEAEAPDARSKDAIETNARALFGQDAGIDITIADGTPADGWLAATAAALDALATLRRGRVSLTETEVILEGDVAADVDIEAIDIFAAAVPDNYVWRQDVAVRRSEAEPFTFTVVKDPDGTLRLEGFAPDEATRAELIAASEAIAGDKAVVPDIQIADGMPDEEWPSLVQAGISAMKDMEAGRFDVVDSDVSFSSDPAVTGDEATAATLAETDDVASTQTDASVDAAATPGTEVLEETIPTLTIDKVETGLWSIRGVVPDEAAEQTLVATLQDQAGDDEVDVELDVAGTEPDDDWLRYAANHIRTLDQVSAGRLSLEGRGAHLIGVVETPEDIEPVQAALAAIDQSMTVDLQPIDPRPVASLDLQLSLDEGIALSGALPGGLTEGEALLALGIQRYDGKLDEDARGSADAWRQDLADLGAVLPAFEAIDLSLGGERPKIKGVVHTHADADSIARALVLTLGEDRQPLVDVATTTTIIDDGVTRTSPLTGQAEIHRRGYWLPVIEIAAEREACYDHASSMLESSKITFLRGEETLDTRAEPTLNALASLALTCLENTDLVLEIGGHTDSRGGAQLNQELSQARADAVLNALVARGVDADAMIAVGYGDTQPIADNATDEGRAANRRTTFEWRTSDDAGRTSGEG